MENKYREALNILTDYFHAYHDSTGLVHERHITDDYNNAKGTIVELINNYEELLDKFNRQNDSYGNCCIEREQYKKALDKACEYLAQDSTMTKDQWKELLSKDE